MVLDMLVLFNGWIKLNAVLIILWVNVNYG